jgi:hypothetical protein
MNKQERRTDIELLELMLSVIQSNLCNDITSGMCYFGRRLRYDYDVITEGELFILENIIYDSNPIDHDDYPEEFRGKQDHFYYFKRGDWDIRGRFVEFLIKIKKENHEGI